MTQLDELDVSNNALTTIPDEIGELKNLVRLNLSGNKLTTLPASIGNLVNLESLDIKSNEISNLPDDVGKLVKCKKMDYGHNMLTELPWDLARLESSLNVLELGHNPLVIPPRPIINRGTPEVLKWLKQNEKEGRKAKVSGLGIQKDDTKK